MTNKAIYLLEFSPTAQEMTHTKQMLKKSWEIKQYSIFSISGYMCNSHTCGLAHRPLAPCHHYFT